MTIPTNIWAWQPAIMIALELHGCCNANIEHRSLLILAVFVFSLPTAHLPDVWFTIAHSIYTTL